MTIVYTVIASIVVFGVVIFLHELGHFTTAKLVGIQVNEFSLGMGPQLLSFLKGSTRYSLRLLPIGGFVAMEGEDGEEPDEEALLPLPNDIPRGKSFQQVSVGRRAIVIAAGAVMNLILGFVLLVILVCGQDVITSRTVAEFRGENAQQTGLAVGDTILAINGRRCLIANDVVYEMVRSQDATANFTVLRNGEKLELENVTFATPQQDGEGMMIDFTVQPVKKTVGTVLQEAANWTVSYARLVMMSLADLISGRVAITELSGPVGIVQVINDAVSYGVTQVLNIMAFITINLGIFNLLPLPALDGGKLVLLVVEKLRGKPLPAKYEGMINMVGFAALLLLLLFITFNDIGRLVGLSA